MLCLDLGTSFYVIVKKKSVDMAYFIQDPQR